MQKEYVKKILFILLIIILSLSTISFADEEINKDVTENPTGNNEQINTENKNIDTTLLDATIDDYDITSIDDKSDNYSNKKVEEDVYLAEEKIKVDYDVEGNVYLMAKEIEISSESINGNVFAMAENIVINNTYIDGSVFIAGKNINFNAYCTDIYTAGENVKYSEGSRILRDAKIVCEDLEIKGVISRNASIASKNVNITEGAVIEGNLDYTSDKEAKIEGRVYGDTHFVKSEGDVEKSKDNKVVKYIKGIIGSVLSGAVIAVFIMLLIPKLIENNDDKFIEAFGAGLGFLIVVPIISIMLFITGFGFFSGCVLLGIYLIMILIASIVASLVIANKIYKKIDTEGNQKIKLFIITVAVLIGLNIIESLPVIGFFVGSAINLIGLGIIVLKVIKSRK